MAPQFVDFNGDGHIDIVTATFDGSPWVSFGSEKGFQAPQHILDKNGKRILLSRFWDYESRRWTSDDQTGGVAPSAHCTSAFAIDWNGNGVLDLLLGDYRTGFLFVQLNEGTAAEPKFSGVNKPVMVGDKPLKLEGKVATPRMLDWNGNGLPDLIIGTFGDASGAGAGAGVVWFPNVGKPGEPQFKEQQVLIELSRKNSDTAVRPDFACYFDVVDYNGNGKLDLVVGGYALVPAANPRNPSFRQRVAGIWVFTQRATEEGRKDKKDETRPEQ